MFQLLLITILVISFLIWLYRFTTKNHSYWLKKNVKHEPPIPLFGNLFWNSFGYKSLVQTTKELCAKFPEEPAIGFYRGRTPELIVQDQDLIRQILLVDFNSFYSRGYRRNPEVEPIYATLFAEDGDTWKLLRHRLTPAFTTAKLKAMFPLVIECAERLQNLITLNNEFDARELMARFTTDFIGACGFGVEMNSMNDEQSQFREMGKRIFSKKLRTRLLLTIIDLFPGIKPYFRIDDKMIEDLIVALVKAVREQRNYKPIGRNDFMDLLLELEANRTIKTESIEKTNPDGSPVMVEMEMTLLVMAAQVFVFFAAGFETSSSSTSYTLHELAYNPEVQKKVQEETDRVMEKHNNKLCYEAVSEMTYLEMTFKEGMRKFPAVGVLTRVCTKPCKLDGLDITLDPGVRIMIPAQVIQMDEKYYDNPEEFRPERFTPDEISKRPNFCYLPFGDGPRACIGEKLGMTQSVAGLAAILRKFTVTPAPSSKRKPNVSRTYSNVTQSIIGGLPLIFTPRKKEL